MCSMLDVLIDSLLDTLKLVPFLFLIYVVIELIEHNTSLTDAKLTGKMAPLLGAVTGLIPQCGFSVMAAKLYDKGFLRTGTILAVFLATSDEAFIILLSSGTGAQALLPMILVKLAVAVAAGYLANWILKGEQVKPLQQEEHCHSCGHEHDEQGWRRYLLSPFLHTLQVAAFIFLVVFAFGALYALVGEERVLAFLHQGLFVQPFITVLIGLIPNCASSVVITTAYLSGAVSFGSCAAGLCANAGLGFVVLLKNTAAWRRNLFLFSTICVISLAVGLALNALSLVFAA